MAQTGSSSPSLRNSGPWAPTSTPAGAGRAALGEPR